MKPFLRLAFALAAVTSVAAAQPAPRAPAKTEKPTHLNYDDPDVLEVDLARPDDSWITARGGVKHKSLIKVRATFYLEMMKRAESL